MNFDIRLSAGGVIYIPNAKRLASWKARQLDSFF